MTTHRTSAGLLVLVVGLLIASAALRWRVLRETGPPTYHFVVAPGDDPACLHLDFPGAGMVELDRTGELTVKTGNRTMRSGPPHAYQQVDGARRAVGVRFVIDRDGLVRFALGSYDRSRPLIVEATH